MLNIAVLVSGGGTNLQAIIDAIELGKIEGAKISLVVSSRNDAYALQRAANANIDAVTIASKDYENEDDFADAMIEEFEKRDIGLIVLAGYLTKVPNKLVERYPEKIINIHPALIPAFSGKGYYGLHVHRAALARGVKITGATVHYVNEGLDEGKIIMQKAVEVLPDDTPESLQKRVMELAEWQILPEAIAKIAKEYNS